MRRLSWLNFERFRPRALGVGGWRILSSVSLLLVGGLAGPCWAQEGGVALLHGSIDAGGQFASSARFEINGAFSAFGAGAVSEDQTIRSGFAFPGMLNEPPEPRNDGIERPAGSPIKIRVPKLLLNDFDLEGDPLTMILPNPTSDLGAGIMLDGEWIFYTPPTGEQANGDDSIPFQVVDGTGIPAPGTLFVVVADLPAEGEDPAQPSNLLSLSMEGDDIRLTFVGVPGTSYKLQFRESVDSPEGWQDFPDAINPLIETASAQSGIYRFLVVAMGVEAQGFFRAVPVSE